MLAAGDLDRSQFERLELEDGRLPDGTSILSLFYSEDKNVRKYLSINVADPCDVINNNSEEVLNDITKKRKLANTDLVNSTSEVDRWWPKISLYALDALEELYSAPTEEEMMAQQGPLSDQRTRTVNPETPQGDENVTTSSNEGTETPPEDRETTEE
jgi:hypothetical protein